MKISQKHANYVKNLYKNVKDCFSQIKNGVVEEAQDLKKTVEPEWNSFLNTVGMAVRPPKSKVLKEEVTKLQAEYFRARIGMNLQQDDITRFLKEKEIAKLETKVFAATERYNRFVAREAACQKAMDMLNNNK